ncbi:phosphatase 2C domain-containing protein [Amniculicola lignicola CBS 123094]|uniref:Phosphatase 2C domain-containing protein n=1 Tax=Amniculicola lignicola CBS 123094 TaxID=1392246 RepID=A0A6A5W3U8_9PLEO|nr:phosphatase 2C domain-containing protein [Amniculicola lignicola CBS 123094]
MWNLSLPTGAIRRPAVLTASRTNCLSHTRIPSTRTPRWPATQRRYFQEYFITHLPSSSLHPDSRSHGGPHHKLPRDKSTPHEPHGTNRSPAAAPPMGGLSRELTVVRIPLKSAKHHYGVSLARGQRPYNEDAFQAGTIELPAFAKRRPMNLVRNPSGGIKNEVTPADSASGDPQVFYFAVFDGHGGAECSGFLREQLHTYVEEAAKLFELQSSLRLRGKAHRRTGYSNSTDEKPSAMDGALAGEVSLKAIKTHTPTGTEPLKPPAPGSNETPPSGAVGVGEPMESDPPVKQSNNIRKAEDLERALVREWKELVGGYFRRFKPEFFSTAAGGHGHPGEKDVISKRYEPHSAIPNDAVEGIGIETVLEYAFLKADYDFISAQVGKTDEDSVHADRAINDDDILGQPSKSGKRIGGGSKRFKGGSTCSIALISTPTASPYWHPASPSSLVVAHVGDTRILLCNTATGLAHALTLNHHPSLPQEATRLRRYAATFVTDSFGEERVSGLANTRAFGDMASKRIGVSAEPEIRRIELSPAEYSFMVMVSDGVSGHLSDQEIVDIVKEAKTPEQAARDVTSFATETSLNGDNATTLVVRLGGWERRIEGGLGSMGTREMRDWRKGEAENPRGRRM